MAEQMNIRFRRWMTSRKDFILAFLFFCVVATVLTYPFVRHPFSTLVAAPSGDVSNSVTKFEAIKREGANPLRDDRLYSVNAPEGIESNVAVDRISILSTLPLWGLTLVANSLFAHGFLTFMAYTLSGFFVFILIYRITKSWSIALLFGLVSCVFPLYISLARAAPIYMHLWLYVLPVLAFLNLHEKVTRKNILLSSLSIVPGLFWTPYIAFHILLIAATIFFFFAYTSFRSSNMTLASKLRPLFVVGGTWLFFIIIYILIGTTTKKGGAPERSLQDAYEQAVNPLMLVLPGMFSTWGSSIHNWASQHIIASLKATNLYLGVSVLALALYGAVRSRKSRKNLFAIKLLIILSFVLFLFSLPPSFMVGNVDVPTPNKIVVSFMPALRASQRLVAPLMVMLLPLAALGFQKIITNTKYHSILAIVLAGIVLVDLSSRPPNLTYLIPYSQAMQDLSRQEPGLTAQYVHSSVGDPGQAACHMQLQHQNPIINDCGIKPTIDSHHVSELITRVGNAPHICAQKQLLHDAGVKYVIIAKTEWDKVVDCYRNNPSAHVVADDSLYTVFLI